MSGARFTAVMIVPTGIGCSTGGHAGDATLAAALLVGACDELVLHPNVVNAADLCEIPANALYVEGSMLDRFLRGEIALARSRANRILVVTDADRPCTRNAAAAARVLLGADVRVLVTKNPPRLTSIDNPDGTVGGYAHGVGRLCVELGARNADYDAVAVHTPVEVDRERALAYMRGLLGANPWGGAEAVLSREMSLLLGCPVAHAPVEQDPGFDEVVPAPMAAELVSGSMLFSVLKGLHRAPLIASGREPERDVLRVRDVDALVTPDCWGEPHEACVRAGIPIVRVTGNTTLQPAGIRGETVDVENYAEAAGTLVAARLGLDPRMRRRRA